MSDARMGEAADWSRVRRGWITGILLSLMLLALIWLRVPWLGIGGKCGASVAALVLALLVPPMMFLPYRTSDEANPDISSDKGSGVLGVMAKCCQCGSAEWHGESADGPLSPS